MIDSLAFLLDFLKQNPDPSKISSLLTGYNTSIYIQTKKKVKKNIHN